MNKYIYLLVSFLFSVCDEPYIEINGDCYHQDDIEFLQRFIDISNLSIPSIENLYNFYNSIPPPSDLDPLNLGYQVWENNRLIQFCSSYNSNGLCSTEYMLAGIGSTDWPSELRYLDLRNNAIQSVTVQPPESDDNYSLEYLYLSDNNIKSIPSIVYDGFFPNLKELHISNNEISEVYIPSSYQDDACNFLNNQLLSYNFSGNYICDIDTPSCINKGDQNVYTCCDDALYQNYRGHCYYYQEELNAIQYWVENYYSIDFTLNENHRLTHIDLSNNQINLEYVSLYPTLFTFEDLESLYLNDNLIAELYEDFFMDLPSSIQTLDLSGNLISSLDESDCEVYNPLDSLIVLSNIDINLSYNPICESENLLSCLDDNVCFVLDCTDSNACNYNQYATDDNGLCIYPETNYNCAGDCIVAIDECGECGGDGIDPWACDCEGALPISGYDCNGEQLSIKNSIPIKFELLDIFPNPFNPSTTISLAVDLYSDVKINIYNMKGMLVEEILNKNLYPGVYDFRWAPKSIANGVYLVSIDNGIDNIIQKVTFIK